MSQPSLEDTVFGSQKFRDIISNVRRSTIRSEFPSIEWDAEEGSIDWGFALLYASAITSSQSERAQSTVLRITTACMQSAEADPTHKAAAAALLERSGNHMAVKLAESRERIPRDAWLSLPSSVRMDVIRNRIKYSIHLSDGRVLPVNPFQEEFWGAVGTNDWLSVSAPTSAGKSRIVREHFLESARRAGPFVFIYMVPTRALIEEVSRDLREEVPSNVDVFTMPWDPDLATATRTTLVVTQERLHLIQHLLPDLKVDLLFVDEAQSLAGGARGVLLQYAIERTVRRSPNAQVLFASPLSSNPESLVEDLPEDRRSESFVSEAVTVNQNLIRVEGVRRAPKRRSVSLVSNGAVEKIGEITLAQRATTIPLRIASVAYTLSGNSPGNVVYVNTASEAEKVAKAIFEHVPPPGEPDQDIEEMRDLVRTSVHGKYLLADVLERRVAFHYGNMPLILRTQIERLFTEGKIHYLVCTSTLLEGVNLPCRTIYMRNPKKGTGRPLKEGDFWNLAGRAGRWGKEFEGNVVCIDTDDTSLWENLPSTRKRSRISRSVITGLTKTSDLLDFVRSMDQVQGNGEAQGLFAYLCTRVLEGQPIKELLAQVPNNSDRYEIKAAVEKAVNSLTIPAEVVIRHTGIDPLAMERLMESFRKSGQSPAELLLPLPEESDAKQRFQEALVRIGEAMTNEFGGVRMGEDRRKWQLANMLVNWMKGMPLSRLIDQRLSFNKDLAVSSGIREVMRDVESIARFHAPRYLSCYADLLKVYASEIGVEADEGPDYAMMLELGVSRTSEVVLMSLGLSRTATVAISEFIGVDSWSRSEALAWLMEQNLDGLGVPALLQLEISQVIELALRRK